MSLKQKLKAVREALEKKDFQSAHDASLQILEYEPENYFAYVSCRCAALSRFDKSAVRYSMAGLCWNLVGSIKASK
jgi:superkiller protein 3